MTQMDETGITGYRYAGARAGHRHGYLLPTLFKIGRIAGLAKSMFAVARRPST
jgi:hypothetical protein